MQCWDSGGPVGEEAGMVAQVPVGEEARRGEEARWGETGKGRGRESDRACPLRSAVINHPISQESVHIQYLAIYSIQAQGPARSAQDLT